MHDFQRRYPISAQYLGKQIILGNHIIICTAALAALAAVSTTIYATQSPETSTLQSSTETQIETTEVGSLLENPSIAPKSFASLLQEGKLISENQSVIIVEESGIIRISEDNQTLHNTRIRIDDDFDFGTDCQLDGL